MGRDHVKQENQAVLNEIGAVTNAPEPAQWPAPSKLNILQVEDNELDIEIFRRAMRKTGLPYPVTVARNGIEALTILRGNENTAPLARPSVVLLDLNMPRMNGLEFLDEVRVDPALQDLVVFILTTSDAPRDMIEAYKRNVTGYILKSISGPSVGEALELIRRFVQIVKLPT
jgi:CheY-like chemotaxis protein